MRKGENMVTLEKLRLREVALNSLLAKMGKDLRVKATVVRKTGGICGYSARFVALHQKIRFLPSVNRHRT